MKKLIKILYGAVPAALLALFMAVSCAKDGNMSGSDNAGSGQGGSMARFTINGDYLYTVGTSDDDYYWSRDKLTVLSLADPSQPGMAERISLDFGIETIFFMDDKLFIGSRSAMYIYDITNPEDPQFRSIARHFTSCDPVVAYGNYAYVTLNSSLGNFCGQRGDVLQVYDITNIANPRHVGIDVTMSSPRGLAVDGAENLLFVCDNVAGVKVYDIIDPENIQNRLYSLANIPQASGIDAYDCIAMDGVLMVIGADGLYQLRYTRDGFEFLSKIDLR